MRAMMRVSAPITSACSLAATRRSMCSCMETSTLPPMCPHFLVPGFWSSRWMPAAPRSMNSFVSFITAVTPLPHHITHATDHVITSTFTFNNPTCHTRTTRRERGEGPAHPWPVSASAMMGLRKSTGGLAVFSAAVIRLRSCISA